jgi:hypothetical protein
MSGAAELAYVARLTPSTPLTAEGMMKVRVAREAARAAFESAMADPSVKKKSDASGFTIALSEVARHLRLENDELREFCASVRARCTGGQIDPLKCGCVVLDALSILLKLPARATFAPCACYASPSGVVQ